MIPEFPDVFDSLSFGGRRALRKLGQPVFLTGSRFFGTEEENSDWDFFTSQAVSDGDFRRAGFVQLNISAYLSDPSIASVWMLPGKDVHVQVVKDVEHKKRAQQFLKKTEAIVLLQYLISIRPETNLYREKEVAIIMWKMAYDATIEE